jgi:hypothetical protein
MRLDDLRAVADQLEGNEEEHLKYRKMVVDFIEVFSIHWQNIWKQYSRILLFYLVIFW